MTAYRIVAWTSSTLWILTFTGCCSPAVSATVFVEPGFLEVEGMYSLFLLPMRAIARERMSDDSNEL